MNDSHEWNTKHNNIKSNLSFEKKHNHTHPWILHTHTYMAMRLTASANEFFDVVHMRHVNLSCVRVYIYIVLTPKYR